MSDLRFELLVEYDNGSTQEVLAQQRELAEWEMQPFGSSSMNAADEKPMAFFRFIAWAALKRKGERRSFSTWSDSVVQVMPTDEADQEPADPTPADQPAGS